MIVVPSKLVNFALFLFFHDFDRLFNQSSRWCIALGSGSISGVPVHLKGPEHLVHPDVDKRGTCLHCNSLWYSQVYGLL